MLLLQPYQLASLKQLMQTFFNDFGRVALVRSRIEVWQVVTVHLQILPAYHFNLSHGLY